MKNKNGKEVLIGKVYFNYGNNDKIANCIIAF